MTHTQLKRGLFITVEGLDGSGKSTLAHALHECVTHMEYPAHITREPGGTSVGSSIRSILHSGVEDPQAEFLLFAADRALHMQQVVLPYRDAGYIVISDRSADSSCAYQGYGRGVSTQMIDSVNTWAMQSCTPDVVVYLYMKPEHVYDRIVQRNEQKTAFEREHAAFFERVSAGFDDIFAQRNNVVYVDASKRVADVVEQAIDGILPYIRDVEM